jgi:aspartate aminotransferase
VSTQTIPSPVLSVHFKDREPSAIRIASIRFANRQDGTEAVNVAIGNVSLPMHPAMIERMRTLGEPGSPFSEGVVKYTATVGTEEANRAVLNVIASSGCCTDGLLSQITDGGSQAMELILLGCCGPAGSSERPLLLIDAAYTNYKAFASRVGRSTVSIQREFLATGKFSLPSLEEIENLIVRKQPGAMVVIPYDNPTGHFYDHATMVSLARLCVKHNLWIVSDEAYRELFYGSDPVSSVWKITEAEVPGITGRRISLETASKVWNACGLRIGALVTDNAEFHQQSVAENTANLCSSAIGQHIYGALAHLSQPDLQSWYASQRAYYAGMLNHFTQTSRQLLPGALVSSPDAAIYSSVDLRNIARPGFDALQFVLYCASRGFVEEDGKKWTLLTAPMDGFYSVGPGQPNPGKTQLRVAYVESPERMQRVPGLLARLFQDYEAQRA